MYVSSAGVVSYLGFIILDRYATDKPNVLGHHLLSSTQVRELAGSNRGRLPITWDKMTADTLRGGQYESQNDPTRADRSQKPLLEADQVLALSAAGIGHTLVMGGRCHLFRVIFIPRQKRSIQQYGDCVQDVAAQDAPRLVNQEELSAKCSATE